MRVWIWVWTGLWTGLWSKICPFLRRFQSAELLLACVLGPLFFHLAYLTSVQQIDVQIATYHLMDHIEWDLLSPLTPEEFSRQLCSELGLTGEAVPLIAHAIHEELMKHKKDAVEWGVIGGEREAQQSSLQTALGTDDGRGIFVKDKTGLGHNWGRTPRDGRGPKVLRSVWRDWADAEEYRTRFEVLTAEEVERREIEKERASR